MICVMLLYPHTDAWTPRFLPLPQTPLLLPHPRPTPLSGTLVGVFEDADAERSLFTLLLLLLLLALLPLPLLLALLLLLFGLLAVLLPGALFCLFDSLAEKP